MRRSVSRPRHALLGLGLAVVCAFAIVGCGSSGPGGRPAGVIHIAALSDNTMAFAQHAVAEYNATPEGKKVKAVLDTYPAASYQQKLQTIMGTSKAPDVFFNWGAGSVSQFAKQNLVMSLNGPMASDPALKSDYLPVVMNAAKIGSDYYGIPMLGTEPVVLYYNKAVLAKYHLSPPATWTQLLHEVSVLKAGGLIPIALGGGEQWPTQMWYQYVYDRVAGPSLIPSALSGDTKVWKSTASVQSLADLKTLVNSGAFGHSFDSVQYSDGASTKLMVTGKSAFQLMGSWDYADMVQNEPSFVKTELGYTTFPTIPGETGSPTNLTGNVQNYYSVLKQTRYPQASVDFLKVLSSQSYLADLIKGGYLPTTTSTLSLVKGPEAPWLKFLYTKVTHAQHFQESWDQFWPPTDANTIHTAVEQYFNNLQPSSFISAMQGLGS